MTNSNCTASSVDLKNTTYLYPVISSSKPLHLNEDGDEYSVSSLTEDTLQWDIKRAELKALRTTASGQVGRLYKLATLLIQNEPIDRMAEDLKQVGLDVRNAASILEDTVQAIVGPMVDDSESDDEEFDE